MSKLIAVLALLLCGALACAEPRSGNQLQRKQRSGAAAALPPYLFLTARRGDGNGHNIHGFRVVESDDDVDNDDNVKAPLNNINNDDDDNEEDANDDDADNEEDEVQQDDEDINEEHENDDDDENVENDATNNLVYLRSRIPHTPRVRSQLNKNEASVMAMMKNNRVNQLNAQLVMKNAKPTNMMVSREHAGAIMVPDGFIEIEGQTIVDEKTGKTSLLVPRSVLDAIPEGSVVALMDGSAQDSEEARANRVIVRRRRKGSRRNVVRRGGNRRGNRRRQGGQRRRVQVYRIGGTNNNRRRRVRRPVVWQG